ncbi:hypothetical protein LAZ67_2003655 [Cordylochernes scorpioides]|uniref:Uncharacterized protein n=1 Tax=Cordylochernes scorpioides TaxID=51811 RepID=A0ABY6K7P9_9ARAC|nr:hypothetical protein LAZ67_2003655 [Cordylochernes scorpioides]
MTASWMRRRCRLHSFYNNGVYMIYLPKTIPQEMDEEWRQPIEKFPTIDNSPGDMSQSTLPKVQTSHKLYIESLHVSRKTTQDHLRELSSTNIAPVFTKTDRFQIAGLQFIKRDIHESSWIDTHSEKKRKIDSVEQEETTMNIKKEATNQVGSFFIQHLPRNPSMFSGEGAEDPHNWLKKYERVAKHNQWDETLCLANVYFYLTGTASNGLRTMRRAS